MTELNVTLMSHNTEVLKYSIDSTECKIINKNLVPFQIKDNPNIIAIDRWLSERAIPLDRENAKWILTAMHYPQGNDLLVIYRCRALNLQDTYWLKFGNENILWEDINLYTNPFSHILADIAIKGSGSLVSIQEKIATPEVTTDGTYAKCWRREPNGIYLYKKDYNGCEVNAEIVSSLIADKLKIPHVPYTEDYIDGIRCSKCKCICNEDLSLIPALGLSQYIMKKTMSKLEAYLMSLGFMDWLNLDILQNDKDTFLQMFLLDGLIGNVDRHLRNWGFTYNSHTHGNLRLAPLFDHNCAIDISHKCINEVPHSTFGERTICDYAIYAFNHLDSMQHLLQDLCNWYYSSEADKYFNSMYSRLDELELLKYNFSLVTQDKIKPTQKRFFDFLNWNQGR